MAIGVPPSSKASAYASPARRAGAASNRLYFSGCFFSSRRLPMDLDKSLR